MEKIYINNIIIPDEISLKPYAHVHLDLVSFGRYYKLYKKIIDKHDLYIIPSFEELLGTALLYDENDLEVMLKTTLTETFIKHNDDLTDELYNGFYDIVSEIKDHYDLLLEEKFDYPHIEKINISDVFILPDKFITTDKFTVNIYKNNISINVYLLILIKG